MPSSEKLTFFISHTINSHVIVSGIFEKYKQIFVFFSKNNQICNNVRNPATRLGLVRGRAGMKTDGIRPRIVDLVVTSAKTHVRRTTKIGVAYSQNRGGTSQWKLIRT